MRGAERLCLATLLITLIHAPNRAFAQDLPFPSSNQQLVPKGSLVIPMDNDKQSLVGPFNIRAYGLVNDLLQNDIPVKWAIRAGKAKDAVDFTAMAGQVSPSAGAPALASFSGGPFVVHEAYATQALARAALFPTVTVYELTEDILVDVRHEMTFKPLAFVNATNSSIATDVLDAAGISDYVIGNDFSLLTGSCYTLVMEPHTDDNSGVSAVRSFLQSGGNLLAQCRSVDTYENDVNGKFVTTLGLAENNIGNALAYTNPDLPFSQFVGALDPAPGGSHQDWELLPGSVFQSSGHIQLDNVGASPPTHAALVSTIYAGQGGMAFYLGGHDWDGNDLVTINGQRMMLNALMTPPTRPASCGLTVAVPDLTISKSHTSDFVEGSAGVYTIAVTNSGDAVTIDTITVTDTLPAGLTFVSGSGPGWTVSAAGQVVTAEYTGTLDVGASSSFQLTVGVGTAAVPSVTNVAHVAGGGEVNTANDTASDPTTVTEGFDLSLSATDAPDPVPYSDTITYTLTVNNLEASAGQATGVQLVDSLPADVTFVSATPSQGSCAGTSVVACDLGSVANGASATVIILARAAGTGPLQYVARVTANEADSDSTNNRVSGTTTGEPATVRDELTAISYTGNDGNVDWTGGWLEFGETTSPTSGSIRVVSSSYCATGSCLRIGGDEVSIDNRSVYREADLFSATSATLTFSYRRQLLDETGGSVSLQASGDGGNSWVTLETFSFNGSDGSQQPRACDISSHIASNTRLRFLGSGSDVGSYLYVDDVQIEFSDQPAGGTGCISGGAERLAFVVQPWDTEVDQTISPSVQVAIQDGWGETITSATDAVTLAIGTNPTGGTFSGTLTVSAVNGIATFPDLSIGHAGNGYTLAATSGTLTSATSNPFNVIPGCYLGGGGAPVTFQAFTEAKLGLDGTSLTLPTVCGTNLGDLLIAAVVTDGNTTGSLAPPAGQGWTQLDLRNFGASLGATHGVWWKLAGASEPQSHVFTWSGGEQAYGAMYRFTGHDPAAPINASSFDAGLTPFNAPEAPALTTSVDSTLVLRVGAFDGMRVTVDAPGLPGHTPITMDLSSTSLLASVSAGAGYLSPLTPTGVTGPSAFALNALQLWSTGTIAIAPGDTTPPAAISNLATGLAQSTAMELTWTAPGDDANAGQAASYDLRYSTSPITEADWGAATQVTGEPLPQPAGSAESFSVTGLSPGTTYYFAIKTTDDFGNVSQLSNVATGTTTTCATVTTVAELRAQLADPGCPIINVAPGTYVLTTSGAGPLEIERGVSVLRAAPGDVILDGAASSAVFDIKQDVAVIMDGLTIQNGSRDDGAGIRMNKGNATLTLTNSTVRSNTGKNGAGLFIKGTLILERSTVSGNVAPDNGGAGIFVDGGSFACVNSTISGNTATKHRGGGLRLKGGATATLTNCTIAGNQADEGGGIYNEGSSVTLMNTIVADNSANVAGDQIAGAAIVSNGYNLVEGGCSGCQASDLAVDPALGPLADNGGDTQTHELLPTSPALEAALDSDAPAVDQRGIARPQRVNADIGAYEREPEPPGSNVTPDGGQNLEQLPSNGTNYTVTFKVLNDGVGGDDFLLTAFPAPGGTLGVVSVNGQAGDTTTITLAAGDSLNVDVVYSVGDVAAGTADSLYLRARAKLDTSISDTGFADLSVVRPNLTTGKTVSPSGTQLPGTDLTYSITITNDGTADAVNVVEVDSLPPELEFRVGTVADSLPVGVTVTVTYSSDGGSTWTYTPVSEGCAAPVGYDGCVTHIRWAFDSNLSAIAPDNSGTLEYVARIK